MASPTLEPYREEILTKLRRGQPKAGIWRALERGHGVKISKSQFYAFVEELSGTVTPETREEPFMVQRETWSANPATVDEKARAFFEQLPLRVQEVGEGVADLMKWLTEKEAEAQQRDKALYSALQQVREMLSGIAKQPEALRVSPRQAPTGDPPEKGNGVSPAMLRHIWKRAFIVSGIIWGVIVVLFVLGYWQPLWTAVANVIET